MHDFYVVVGKPDCRKRAGGKYGDPYKAIRQVSPKQGRNHNRDGDEQAAHGRRTGLFLVSLRALLANVLTDLKLAQGADHQWDEDQAGKQGGEAGKGRAESEIPEDTE